MKQNWRKLLLIFLPLLAAIYVLYPTYQASNYEDLWEIAKFDARQKSNTADSIARLEKFKDAYGEDFENAKQKRLKLGLDLRGGMYVTLEVDVIKLIQESAQKDAVDETFEKVIKLTEKEVGNSDEDVLDVFMKNFNTIAKPEGKSLISYFDIGDLSNATDDAIIKKLKESASSAVEQAKEVIRQRIDKYGVSEPNIQQQGSRRILVELPGVSNEDDIRQLISTTARLEFNLVRNNEKIVRAIKAIDGLLANRDGLFGEGKESLYNKNVASVAETPTELSTTTSATTSSSTTTENIAQNSSSMTEDTAKTSVDNSNPYKGLKEDQQRKLYRARHKFSSLFVTYYVQNRSNSQQYDYEVEAPAGDYAFSIPESNIDKFNAYLQMEEVQKLIPYNLKVLVGAKAENEKEKGVEKIFRLNCVEKEPELMGDVITDAGKNIDQTNGSWVVNMTMNTEGAEKWAKITGANVGKQIAIILDDRVYSAPNVIQKIPNGSSVIQGMADVNEANLLEIVLKAGALKAPVKIIEERVVGASLGDDSISAGVNSSIVAFILVMIFMVVYYSKAGFVADIALIVNVSLILTILASLGGTLTLPGIAGIILTMGMAVDANILIYERTREELLKGKSIKAAVEEGFAKAMSAIIDSNITTFLSGLILYYFGSGIIQGFALTLMFGILTTLFTAIFVSRALIELQLNNNFSFGLPKNS